MKTNKTIKLVDLIVKIANKEELPKEIEYQGTRYIFDEDDYKLYKDADLLTDDCLIRYINAINLDDEVEIIEEEKEDKKIEKLDVVLLNQCDNWLQKRDVNIKSDFELNPYIIENIRENILYFQRKINELIDIVNDLRGDKNEG